MKKSLENIEINITGNWNAPRNYLNGLTKQGKAVLYDTMSSAGDWGGLFVTKHYKKYLIIPFSQENNWPKDGYTLTTGKVIAEFDTYPTNDELNELYFNEYQ